MGSFVRPSSSCTLNMLIDMPLLTIDMARPTDLDISGSYKIYGFIGERPTPIAIIESHDHGSVVD